MNESSDSSERSEVLEVDFPVSEANLTLTDSQKLRTEFNLASEEWKKKARRDFARPFIPRKLFPARWDGRCTACEEPFRAGASVRKVVRGYAHELCSE